MSKLYEREIKEFFEVAKIKMAGTSKDPKGKFGKHYDSHVKLNMNYACLPSCSSLKRNEFCCIS